MSIAPVRKKAGALLALAAVAVFACAAATAPVPGQGAKEPVRVVGMYTNMRYTPEHAYGYLLNLWQQGDRIIGLFQFSDGLQADCDTGTLDKVSYDPQSGALAFESYAGMFQFSGTLTQEALSGRVSRASRIGAPRAEQEDVILRRAEATKDQRPMPRSRSGAKWPRSS